MIYGLAAGLVLPLVIAYTQAHGFTSFYELQGDELPGPMGMGDPALEQFEVGFLYALFVLTMTPVFWLLSGPWLLFIVLLILNVPLSLYIGAAAIVLVYR